VIRRSFPVFLSCLALLMAGCAGASSTGVSASLGARSLPSIKPPAFVPGPLDGESTPRSLAMRRPLAVIVENFAPDSRPQTGLGRASMVIETLAEGGVTRFMALYLEKDAPTVGPIRSTRMYFDHWAASFHSILAHVGGNDDAQALLWQLPKVFNIDENKTEVNLYNTGTNLFWRSSARVPPHNLYTSTYKLRSYAERKKQDWAYTGAYLLHKHAALLNRRGHSGSITIDFEDPLYPHLDPNYNVRYTYDRASNSYLRIMGGSPHIDAATRKPLKPSNVIIMRTAAAVADPNAGPTPESILIPTVGSGVAWYFRDGHVSTGRWHQANVYAPLRFLDKRGHEVAFNPGQTWIEVVPAGSAVSWTFH
jgi:Protein of unknown function (DUF3048) N-terminal domain/Protein of unknown function (DUF3048) C-terminal domain